MSEDVPVEQNDLKQFGEGGGSASGVNQLPRLVVLVMVSGGIALAGSILPWASVLVFSVSGTDTGYGKITLALSAVGMILIFVATRRSDKERLFVGLASGCLAVTAGIYLYVAGQMSAVFADDDSEFVSGWVSRGFGLEIGVVSAVVCATLTFILFQHVRRRGSLVSSSERFSTQELVVVAVSAAALALLAFYDVFLAPLIGSVVAGAVWIVARRSRPLSLGISRVAALAIVVTFAGAVVEGVVYGFREKADATDFWSLGENESSADGTVDASSEQEDTTSEDSTVDTTVSDDPEACANLFAKITKTEDARKVNECTQNGEVVYLYIDALKSVSCVDGSDLVYSNYGWGKGGGSWQQPGDGPPSFGECQGLDSDLCAEAFAPGVTTNAAWDMADMACLGDDGSVMTVFGGWSMPCFTSDKEVLVNEFGWGFVGEPWQKGDGPDGGC